MATKKQKLSKEYLDTEIELLFKEFNKWFFEKEDNIFLDDFFLLEKKMPKSDITILVKTNELFKENWQNAKELQLTKLKKYAAGDRLNSSIVKQILINEHDWI